MTSLPSPASSPSLEPSDANAQTGRKRQRSRSMQSDTSSSSVKRSISEGIALDAAVRSPSSDQMSSLTLTDPSQEIDSYMAEQGEADIPPFITPIPQQGSTSAQTMTPGEKLAFFERKRGRLRRNARYSSPEWHRKSEYKSEFQLFFQFLPSTRTVHHVNVIQRAKRDTYCYSSQA